jgi:hypothetical protein
MDTNWIAAQRPVFEDSRRPCDVLIFGDSTAMVSLDPQILQGITGLRACNVATTRPTLEIVGLDPLDKYLARNPRPRYLVLQFGANLFGPMPYDRGHEEPADGLVSVLRYYNPRLALEQVLRHPGYLSTISWIVYAQGVQSLWQSIMHPESKSKLTDGYIIAPGKSLANCTLLDLADRQASSAWVHYLRDHYSELADRVIVNVTPTPACNTLYPSWSRDLRGLTDNRLETYPSALFVDGMHLNRKGAVHFSREIAEQILSLEHNASPESSSTQTKSVQVFAGSE